MKYILTIIKIGYYINLKTTENNIRKEEHFKHLIICKNQQLKNIKFIFPLYI